MIKTTTVYYVTFVDCSSLWTECFGTEQARDKFLLDWASDRWDTEENGEMPTDGVIAAKAVVASDENLIVEETTCEFSPGAM